MDVRSAAMQMDSEGNRRLEAARRLSAEFSWRLDTCGGEGVADLFTEDGVYRLDGSAVSGRTAIAEGFRRRAARGPRVAVHVSTGFRLGETSPSSFTVQSQMLVFAADGEAPITGTSPLIVAAVEDRIEVDGDDFLLRERTLTYLFVSGAPVSTPAD